MDYNTSVVSNSQNESLVLVDKIMENKWVSNDVMKQISVTFVVGEAQNKIFLYWWHEEWVKC